MKKTILCGVTALLVLGAIGCSDDKPSRSETGSLAKCYLIPQKISTRNYTDPEGYRLNDQVGVVAEGTRVTFDDDPQKFIEISRSLGADNCPAKTWWPTSQTTFLAEKLDGITVTAGDDWNDAMDDDIPSGTDLSGMFNIRFYSANAYIASGYKDVMLTTSRTVKLADWNPGFGTMITSAFMLHYDTFPHMTVEHLLAGCKGHTVIISLSYSSGRQLKAEGLVYCPYAH